MRTEQDDICRKLKETAREFGQNAVTPAIIIGPCALENQIGGHSYFIAPTLANTTLANVGFKVARFFEDI